MRAGARPRRAGGSVHRMTDDASTTRPPFAATTLDELGSGPGFRKVRAAIGVQSMGINGMVFAPRQVNRWHWHDEQEEIYVVLDGELTVEFEGDDPVVLGPGGVVRVDAPVVRRLVNATDAECTIIALGAKDGYVGRDGQLTEAELAKL